MKIISHVCVNCSVRFYENGDPHELHCPICGTIYALVDGEWVEVMQ